MSHDERKIRWMRERISERKKQTLGGKTELKRVGLIKKHLFLLIKQGNNKTYVGLLTRISERQAQFQLSCGVFCDLSNSNCHLLLFLNFCICVKLSVL